MMGVAGSLSDMDYDKQRAVMGALGAGTQFGVLMPFSRKHESEADAIGLLYMGRAGYDPRESIRFWQRMENVGGPQPPEFSLQLLLAGPLQRSPRIGFRLAVDL